MCSFGYYTPVSNFKVQHATSGDQKSSTLPLVIRSPARHLWWSEVQHATSGDQKSSTPPLVIRSPARYLWWSEVQHATSGDQKSSTLPLVIRSPARYLWIWLDWMFYDHFSAHWLVNWVDEGCLRRTRLAWKKSQKTLDPSKRLHQNKTRSAGKGTRSQHCHYWDCGLGKVQVCHTWRHIAGVWNVPVRWRLQPGLKLPQRPKVFKVFEPKRVGILLYTTIGFI